MLISSHVLAGATIGSFLPSSPSVAFAVGALSHLAMDACPHWGVVPGRPGSQELFLRVARCDGCAALTAMAVAAGLVGPGARRATVAAMLGAALPDLDKPFVHFLGINPFPQWFQRLHSRIQREAPHRLPHEVIMASVLGLIMIGRLRATNRMPSLL